MTPTQRQAMEMALEALGNTWTEPGNVQYNTETAAIQAIRAALAEQPVELAHCEAGPEYCQQCLAESKPTYGSEEVRKLREVIASQAKIIALMEKEQGCPPFWPVVQHLLDEYGLQLIDVVAAYKHLKAPPPAQSRQPTESRVTDMTADNGPGELPASGGSARPGG